MRIKDILDGINKFPPDIYEEYQKIAATAEGKELQADVVIVALQETLQKFHLPPDQWPAMGNLVLRISHWFGELDEALNLDTEGEDPTVEKFMHFAIDLYEDYNRRVNKALSGPHTVPDAPHKWTPFK